MKTLRGLIFSVVFIVMTAPAFAVLNAEKATPVVTDNFPDKKNSEKEIASNAPVTVPEQHIDKTEPVTELVEPTEHTPIPLSKDKPAVTQETKAEAVAVQSEEPVKAPLPLGMAYDSKKTAINAIEKNVVLFRDRLKERFSIWLERSARYMDIMKDVLREKELPEELVFLPIVESGFNLNAYSPARAVGPWQFIASTAKRYGLVIDWWRDERKDPIKSTQAAADYLKDLYKMFGSWNLALAAYNAGEGRISKALKKTDSVDYWSLLHTKQIRNETKEYVPRYIAATLIANTPEDYGFKDLAYHDPLEYDEVTLSSPLDIEVIANCAGVPVKDIRELNPELRRWSTPPNLSQYVIRLPKGNEKAFRENLAKVPDEDRFSVRTYCAKKGDSVKKIAKKVGVPVNAILALNSLSGIEKIDAGEKIMVPPKDKYEPDLDDKASARKVAYKKKSGGKKKSSKKGKKRPVHKPKSKKA